MPTLPKDTDVRAHIVMRRVAFVCLLVAVAMIGARGGAGSTLRNTGPAALLGPFTASISAATWCYYDGLIRGRRPLRLNLEGVIFAMPLAFPAYCVWSRGARGLLLFLGVAAVAVAAATLGAVIGIIASAAFSR